MMKKWKDENHPIDVFYNEIEKGAKGEEEISKEMYQKLEEASKVLKVVEESPYDFSINTMEILLKAEEIKAQKGSKKENFFFLLNSIFILTLYFSFAYFYNIRIILYTQLFFIVLGPWLLIPISILEKRGAK